MRRIQRVVRDRCRGQAGNTLVLFPAAILIVFGLGAIAVESANLFLGTRRLSDIATAIANDATNSLGADGFYTAGGGVAADRAEADTRLAATVAARGGAEVGLAELSCRFTTFDTVGAAPSGVLDSPQVTVACSARIDAVFGGIWAGGSQRTVEVRESARSVRSG